MGDLTLIPYRNLKITVHIRISLQAILGGDKMNFKAVVIAGVADDAQQLISNAAGLFGV